MNMVLVADQALSNHQSIQIVPSNVTKCYCKFYVYICLFLSNNIVKVGLSGKLILTRAVFMPTVFMYLNLRALPKGP